MTSFKELHVKLISLNKATRIQRKNIDKENTYDFDDRDELMFDTYMRGNQDDMFYSSFESVSKQEYEFASDM